MSDQSLRVQRLDYLGLRSLIFGTPGPLLGQSLWRSVLNNSSEALRPIVYVLYIAAVGAVYNYKFGCNWGVFKGSCDSRRGPTYLMRGTVAA